MVSEGGDISARAGHSTVSTGTHLYTFGGQDDDNNKLDDVWMLILTLTPGLVSPTLKEISNPLLDADTPP